MGDFNFPEISYKDNLVSAGPAAATSRFYNMTQDEFITQYVLEPTRMRKATWHQFWTIIGLLDYNNFDEWRGFSRAYWQKLAKGHGHGH